MNIHRKTPLSTSVPREVREFIEKYAQVHNTTLSEALRDIVLERMKNIEIEPLKRLPELSKLSEIEHRLEGVELYLKYLSTKISTLPYHYRDKTLKQVN